MKPMNLKSDLFLKINNFRIIIRITNFKIYLLLRKNN